MIEKLFERFDQHLAAKGYTARGGQIIDASIVLVPTQQNSRDENAELQAGRTPAGWKQKPAKVRQKDRDAPPANDPVLPQPRQIGPGHAQAVSRIGLTPRH